MAVLDISLGYVGRAFADVRLTNGNSLAYLLTVHHLPAASYVPFA